LYVISLKSDLLKQKKFPGSDLSLRLLYVKSNTSNTGKAPNPLGNTVNLFILK